MSVITRKCPEGQYISTLLPFVFAFSTVNCQLWVQRAQLSFPLTQHLLPPGPTMRPWCQGKCSLGSCLFHCVSSMPHPQWHERRLAGGDGRGRKPKQLEHTEPSAFPLQREKCFTFVSLYHNNNNKNAAFVTMLSLDPEPSAAAAAPAAAAFSHSQRDVVVASFHRAIQSASLLSAYVTMIQALPAIWRNNDVMVSMRRRRGGWSTRPQTDISSDYVVTQL